MTAARSFETDRKREHVKELGRLHQQHKEIEAKIDAAYDDKLDGRITEGRRTSPASSRSRLSGIVPPQSCIMSAPINRPKRAEETE